MISMKKLFLQMQKMYDISYIMTFKLNQDFIENLFAILRLNGGTHDHPSPLQALNRLRLVILGKPMSAQLKSHQNTESTSEREDYLISKIFQQKKTNKGKNQRSVDVELSDEENDEPWEYQPRDYTLEEEDGMHYALGYMARGMRKDFPNLGSFTHQLDDGNTESNKENYVEDLSFGGLTQPSTDWLNTADRLESYFSYLHNSGTDCNEPGFRNPKNVRQRTIQKLKSKFPEVPERIIEGYATRRINIRVKHMQKRLQEKKIKTIKILRRFKQNTANENPETIDLKSAILRKKH